MPRRAQQRTTLVRVREQLLDLIADRQAPKELIHKLEGIVLEIDQLLLNQQSWEDESEWLLFLTELIIRLAGLSSGGD